MSTEFRYRGRDVKDVRERAEQQGGSFDRYTDSAIPMLRVGKSHTLRILPPAYDIDIDRWGKNWSIPIYVHYNIGPDKGTYLCLQRMEQGDCPICEARAEQNLQEGEPDPLKPTLRYLCFVIDRDNEREGPMLWALPWTIEREIQSLSLDGKEGLLPIDHPDDGYDISFSREGKGIQTKWVGVKIARRSSPISDNPKTQKAWLAFIEENPLPDTLHFEDYKYLDKVYRAKTPKKDEDRRRAQNGDDDDDRPARRERADRDDDARPAARAGRDDADERRDRHPPERAGRYSADAEAEDIPENVHRRSGSKAEADADVKPARRRGREAAEEDEADEADPAPEAKTRSEAARERVNKLKSGADKNGKADDAKAEPRERPRRRARDEDEDEIPY
jgi:hypothetical protein